MMKVVVFALCATLGAGFSCGWDMLEICKAVKIFTKELDKLPEKIADASKEVLDHFFDEDFGPAIDKLTASAKALEDRAEHDVEKAINNTEVQLEKFARRVVTEAEELAKDVTRDVEDIVNTIESKLAELVDQITSDVDEIVSKFLDRLEMDGKELFCAAQGWIDNFVAKFDSYFQHKDCECIQSMLHNEPVLKQDCECKSCWVHIGDWYPNCGCNPWGFEFGSEYNRAKYEVLKCHVMKPIQWDQWTVEQIVAALTILQEASLSFRCIEDMKPGETGNRAYFAAEYFNVSHTILVWQSAMSQPSKVEEQGSRSSLTLVSSSSSSCAGDFTIPECVTQAIVKVQQAQSRLDDATKEIEETQHQIVMDGATKRELNVSVHKLETSVDHVSQSVPVGMILALPLEEDHAPENFRLCDGSAMSRVEYSELFSAIGSAWGSGDNVNTFNIPDLRGRSLIGQGHGPALSPRKIGERGGEENHVMTVSEIPRHSHGYIAPGSDTSIKQYDKTIHGHVHASGRSSSSSTNSAGSGKSHNNMQPYAVVSFFIKVSQNQQSSESSTSMASVTI